MPLRGPLAGEHIVAMRPTEHSPAQRAAACRAAGADSQVQPRFLFRALPVVPPLNSQLDAIEQSVAFASLCRFFGIDCPVPQQTVPFSCRPLRENN